MPHPETLSRPEIICTTLRDGAQTELFVETRKYFLPIDERLQLVDAEVKLGVRMFEVFAPTVNPLEKDSLQALIAYRDKINSTLDEPVQILVHVMCDHRQIQAALDARPDGLNIYKGTSAVLRETKHKGQSIGQMAVEVRAVLEDVRQSHPNISIRFSGEDAFRTRLCDLRKVYDEAAPYVNRFGTPDTVGMATTDQVRRRVKALRKAYPGIDLEGHFQNDRGFAASNAFEGWRAGMTHMQTTVLNWAERSGLPSVTGFLLNVFIENPTLVQDFDIQLCYPLNVLYADMLGIQVPPTEQVSLTNRTDTAGVHAAAVMNDETSYHPVDLSKFGVTRGQLLLGPLSGWHTVDYYLKHILNFEGVTDETAKGLSAELKTRVTDMCAATSAENILDDLALKRGLTKTIVLSELVENLSE